MDYPVTTRECDCYDRPIVTNAHLRECAYYERAHDPFLTRRWRIYKGDPDEWGRRWVVFEATGSREGHEAYRGNHFEHCQIWLAVRQSDLFRQRAALEARLSRQATPVRSASGDTWRC